MVSASLQCIQAFNQGADPWDLLGAREPRSGVSVTFDETASFMHIGSTIDIQRKRRAAYAVQCSRLNLPAPEFDGLLRNVPAYNNVKVYE